MDTKLQSLLRSWRGAPIRTRRRIALALAMALAFAVQAMVWLWYIDDAAISFNYARNLAAGHGLVAQIGAERVEGYSNPLWVLLLSGWELVGLGGFTASKLLGVAFGLACVPLVWAIARWSRPDRDEVVPLLAAFALAANVQFGIWCTSGLENSLVGLLLAAAIWRTLVETRTRAFPWSAVLCLGLALSRPEGIAYAAVGGTAAMIFSLRDGRGLRPTLVWLAVFMLPFAIYHAIRIDYFAWSFPNTYYAKLGQKRSSLLDWDGSGWVYLRRYAGWTFDTKGPGPGLAQGYLLPVYVLGAFGAARLRGLLAAALAGALLLLPAPPEFPALAGIDPGVRLVRLGLLADADTWLRIRVGLLTLLALLIPFVGARSAGGRALSLCWAMALVSVGFAVGSNGDWMRGYRWFSFAAVPVAVLFAAGVGSLRDLVRKPGADPSRLGCVAGFAVVAALTGLYAFPQARHITWFTWETPISTSSVRLRVDYLHHLMDTLHLDRASVLDIDMGAHVYWSRAEMIDLAGLIDVPIARHGLDREFTTEYLFRERRPDFAHVHGPWAKKSKIEKHGAWRDDYIGLRGYLSGNGVHSGNHIRRDLLFASEWRGASGRRVSFANGAVLAGYDLPGLPSAPGFDLFIELGFEKPPRARAPELASQTAPAAAAADEPEDLDLELEIFLANQDGVVAREVVVPGYGWVRPSDWRDGEVFVGRFTLPLGSRLPPGDYDLGFVLRDARGLVIPAKAFAGRAGLRPGGPVIAGRPGVAARVAAGEVRFPNAVSVVSPGFALERSNANVAAALRDVRLLTCDAAAVRWQRARSRMVARTHWLDENRPRVERALAECFVAMAAVESDRARQAELVRRARTLDPLAPALDTTARELAAKLFDRGMLARGQEDWGESYRYFRAAVEIDPRLAWARRYAEEARIHRLALTTRVRAW